MKKLILTILLAIGLPIYLASASSFTPATLYKGDIRVAVKSQAQAQRLFADGYKLEVRQLLGIGPTTGYSERLTQSITNSATTIYVSSVKDRDLLALPLSSTNKGYFNLEPGGAREESIVCTGVNTSTIALTGCTRGLLATGTDETGSPSRAFSHNAGSKIIMTNIGQFYGNFVDTTTAQTVAGIKTFSSSPIVPTPTTNTQAANKVYVDSVAIAGGANASSLTKGISFLSSDPAVPTTPTALNSEEVAVTSSANKIPRGNGSGKIDPAYIDGAGNYTFSGNNTYSGSNTFSNTVALNGTTSLGGTSITSSSFSKFGGTGSDGALNLTSSSSINLASSSVVIKNYTSINISSTSTLSFTNPATDGSTIILKSQGDCTIPGVINASGMGAAGGAQAASASAQNNGTNVTSTLFFFLNNRGIASSGGGSSFITATTSLSIYTDSSDKLSARKSIYVVPGSGGAGGQSGAGVNFGYGGAGGRGGGALIIECAGNWNFTGTISVAGLSGSTGGASGASSGGGGGGGGGAGGMGVIMYNTLVANSGSYTAAGGNGGNGNTSTAATAGNGGQGAGMLANTGGNGGTSNNGQAASPSGGSGGTQGAGASGSGGGGGGNGIIFSMQNTIF